MAKEVLGPYLPNMTFPKKPQITKPEHFDDLRVLVSPDLMLLYSKGHISGTVELSGEKHFALCICPSMQKH